MIASNTALRQQREKKKCKFSAAIIYANNPTLLIELLFAATRIAHTIDIDMYYRVFSRFKNGQYVWVKHNREILFKGFSYLSQLHK